MSVCGFTRGRTDWPIEAGAIGLILLLNAGLGLYQEQRSEAALTRLKALAGAQAWVVRDGQLVHLPTQAMVPGDRVRLEAGDRVPADGMLDDAHGAMLDESVLTGESVPVDKGDGQEVLSGTLLVRGKAFLDVTTERVRRARWAGSRRCSDEIRVGKTPLERRVDRLGHQIARWVLVLAAVLGVLGLVAEGVDRAPAMVIFAVALAVAAVPEGLPAVLTVALALGVERMARQHAVVRRLSAVEALGSVTVIATDKTGTLTESRMDVRSIDAHGLRPRAGCRRARQRRRSVNRRWRSARPRPAPVRAEHGVDIARMRHDHPRVAERPFDSAWKFARVTVRDGERLVSYLKGAPEVLIGRCALSAARSPSRGEQRPRPMRRRASGFWPLRAGPARPRRDCRYWVWRCSGIRRGPKCPKPCARLWPLAFGSS